MIPGKWDLTVIRQTSRQYSHVKALLFRPRTSIRSSSPPDAGKRRGTGGPLDPGKIRLPQTHPQAVDLFGH